MSKTKIPQCLPIRSAFCLVMAFTMFAFGMSIVMTLAGTKNINEVKANLLFDPAKQ